MDKQEEFLSSLVALCIRYGVFIEKFVIGFGNEVEDSFVFDDSNKESSDIYLPIEDVIKALKEYHDTST